MEAQYAVNGQDHAKSGVRCYEPKQAKCFGWNYLPTKGDETLSPIVKWWLQILCFQMLPIDHRLGNTQRRICIHYWPDKADVCS